ncbi:MAG: hypothetical protein R2912_01515 [Eubacteriales bacterium]
MYEKTTRSNVGVSFGMDGEGSFQSGSTLMRRGGCTDRRHGAKVMEFNGLGAISKSVKAAAAARSWRFKTS